MLDTILSLLLLFFLPGFREEMGERGHKEKEERKERDEYLIINKPEYVKGNTHNEREREEREWKDGEWEKAHPENPAIPWMILGFILVIIGLFIITATSMSVPQPPSGTQAKDWENYADDLQTYANNLKYGSVIEIIGLLIFMLAAIYGVSVNADSIRMIYSKIKKT